MHTAIRFLKSRIWTCQRNYYTESSIWIKINKTINRKQNTTHNSLTWFKQASSVPLCKSELGRACKNTAALGFSSGNRSVPDGLSQQKEHRTCSSLSSVNLSRAALGLHNLWSVHSDTSEPQITYDSGPSDMPLRHLAIYLAHIIRILNMPSPQGNTCVKIDEKPIKNKHKKPADSAYG